MDELVNNVLVCRGLEDILKACDKPTQAANVKREFTYLPAKPHLDRSAHSRAHFWHATPNIRSWSPKWLGNEFDRKLTVTEMQRLLYLLETGEGLHEPIERMTQDYLYALFSWLTYDYWMSLYERDAGACDAACNELVNVIRSLAEKVLKHQLAHAFFRLVGHRDLNMFDFAVEPMFCKAEKAKAMLELIKATEKFSKTIYAVATK